MPGNTIADIAIIPATNTYAINPKFKLVKFTMFPSPDTGLKYVISATTAIPITVNIRFIYLPFSTFFSSFIIKGIENIINPRNIELTLYICV